VLSLNRALAPRSAVLGRIPPILLFAQALKRLSYEIYLRTKAVETKISSSRRDVNTQVGLINRRAKKLLPS
jgi:hypothetical protein